jgi:aspartyl-tRNA(Asn)/glutamyl-tRNA(Gln) amidotransferase subunit C
MCYYHPMVTKEDIKNLASLARIGVSDEEVEKMTSEMDSILGYVGEVQKFVGEEERGVPKLRNVMRGDIAVNKSGEYKEKLLNNAPEREGDYFKVKKIL